MNDPRDGRHIALFRACQRPLKRPVEIKQCPAIGVFDGLGAKRAGRPRLRLEGSQRERNQKEERSGEDEQRH
jgi:hypothetical protein